MENPISRGGIEENILAILDASESKDTRDANDDRIAFLEAVRAASIVPESGTPPTNVTLGCIYPIHPLVLRLNQSWLKAWSPFVPGLGTSSSEREAADKNSCGPFDSPCFHLLIQDLAEVAREANFQALDTKSLGSMLLFQYLVSVLEGDMLPRNSVCGETMNRTILRESLLNMLLGSRKLNYKGLVRDCLTIMCGLYQIQSAFGNDQMYPENYVAKSSCNRDPAVAIAFPEIGKNTCIAVQKLLILIMELDMSKKKADMQGYTTRADGVRTPPVEIILDELTYNKEILSPFLQPSVRTRRSNGSTDDATLSGALKCFSNSTSTKSIIKKIGIEVIQLLLAHAFKAHLLLSSEKRPALGVSDSMEAVRGNPLVEICENMISAFNSLRRADEHMEVLSFGKEALLTAATILSIKS